MSAFAAPFGLKPLYHPSGIIRPKALDIASGYNTNLFQYTPVNLNPAGSGLVIAVANAAAPNDLNGPIVGTFLGVEFTPPNQRRVYSNFWPANQVATQIVAYYTDDQLITYEVQANGPVLESNLGNQYNMTAEVGNTTTGFSTSALDVVNTGAGGSPNPTTGNNLLKVVGLSPGPLNAFGDAFTIVQVQIANHSFTATRAAF